MNKVLRCGLDGYVEFDIDTGLDDVWVTFRMAQHVADLDVWKESGESNSLFFEIDNADNSLFPVLLEVDGTAPGWDDQAGNSGATPLPIAESWQDCEVHKKPDGTFDFYVGGVLVFNGTGTGEALAAKFIFGNYRSYNPAVVFFDDIAIGTTRGGTDLFSDGFESGDLSAWPITFGDVTVIDEPSFVPLPDLVVQIFDLGVAMLADISRISLEKSLTRVWNGPRACTVMAPASDPLLTATWDDGDGLPILGDGGNRKLVVWEAPNNNPDIDDPIFHGRIFGCERAGDENSQLVTITAFDPRVELGYETDEKAGRPVRDGTATTYGDPSFLTPSFTSSVPDQDGISGPDLIKQVLTYSQGDPTANPVQGEGPLPIDLVSGDWDLDVPPALDLNPVDSADWPVMVGDFIQQLIDTNVVDFDLRPIRPGTGHNLAGDLDPYIMVEASAKSKMGRNLAEGDSPVHFDYATGSFNAKAAREVTDFGTHCAHLWYELGPRLPGTNWRGDITPMGSANADLAPAYDASADKYGRPFGSETTPGYDSWIRVFDSLGSENSSRPLYEALYRYEIQLRLEPRRLLYITPCDGAKALFQAPQDFDAGDVVQITTGAPFGKTLDEQQRVYGYTKTWTRENIASLGELLTSPDVALAAAVLTARFSWDTGGGG